jgi:hypothetical protein
MDRDNQIENNIQKVRLHVHTKDEVTGRKLRTVLPINSGDLLIWVFSFRLSWGYHEKQFLITLERIHWDFVIMSISVRVWRSQTHMFQIPFSPYSAFESIEKSVATNDRTARRWHDHSEPNFGLTLRVMSIICIVQNDLPHFQHFRDAEHTKCQQKAQIQRIKSATDVCLSREESTDHYPQSIGVLILDWTTSDTLPSRQNLQIISAIHLRLLSPSLEKTCKRILESKQNDVRE